MSFEVAVDGFVTIYDDETVEECQRALEGAEAAGDEWPNYVVIQKRDGRFVGIVPSADVEWAEAEEMVAALPAASVPRRQVESEQPEEIKRSAIQAGDGLALATLGGEPVAVLLPMRLGLDGDFDFVGASSLPAVPAETGCPQCGTGFRRYKPQVLRRQGKLRIELRCPECGHLFAVRQRGG
jgi:hypothetical protein